MLSFGCCKDFSLTEVSESFYLVVVLSLLMATASLIAKLGLFSTQASEPVSPGSRAQVQLLWRTGLLALPYVESSQIRDQIYVSCIGRQILHHWATKEAPFDSPQWSLEVAKTIRLKINMETGWQHLRTSIKINITKKNSHHKSSDLLRWADGNDRASPKIYSSWKTETESNQSSILNWQFTGNTGARRAWQMTLDDTTIKIHNVRSVAEQCPPF